MKTRSDFMTILKIHQESITDDQCKWKLRKDICRAN